MRRANDSIELGSRTNTASCGSRKRHSSPPPLAHALRGRSSHIVNHARGGTRSNVVDTADGSRSIRVSAAVAQRSASHRNDGSCATAAARASQTLVVSFSNVSSCVNINVRKSPQACNAARSSATESVVRRALRSTDNNVQISDPSNGGTAAAPWRLRYRPTPRRS